VTAMDPTTSPPMARSLIALGTGQKPIYLEPTLGPTAYRLLPRCLFCVQLGQGGAEHVIYWHK
jgi:hypothetical protein